MTQTSPTPADGSAGSSPDPSTAPAIGLTIADGVARLTLQRPPVNALDSAGVDLLDAMLTTLRADDTVRVVVLQSTGRVFSAGADVGLMASFLAEPDGPALLAAYSERMQAVFRRLEYLPVPTIAQLHGATLGGGLELALACDMRIAAAGIRLGLPEANLGIVPGAGGTQRLAGLAGRPFALKAIATGEPFDAEQALARGVVDEVVPAEGLADRVTQVAAAMATRQRITLEQIKRCVLAAGTPGGFAAESDATALLAGQPETLSSMRAFFSGGRG